jgi:hypothetical protein
MNSFSFGRIAGFSDKSSLSAPVSTALGLVQGAQPGDGRREFWMRLPVALAGKFDVALGEWDSRGVFAFRLKLLDLAIERIQFVRALGAHSTAHHRGRERGGKHEPDQRTHGPRILLHHFVF